MQQYQIDRRNLRSVVIVYHVVSILLLIAIVVTIGAAQFIGLVDGALYSSSGKWIASTSNAYLHNGWMLHQKRVQSVIKSTTVTGRTRTSLFLSESSMSSSTTDGQDNNLFFAATADATEAVLSKPSSVSEVVDQNRLKVLERPTYSRTMGSQELLMLPRQYPIGKVVFPQMNHVSCALLKCKPIDVNLLRRSIDATIIKHPLLSSKVIGDGEPIKRIDAFQMVRSSGISSNNEPHPLQFVSGMPYTSHDVLKVIDNSSTNNHDFDQNWQAAFVRDLDNGDWCNITTGPLWKVELFQSENRAALHIVFNHAISDQSSANRLIDEIVLYMAEIEESGDIQNPVVTPLEMPVTLEDSVLGNNQRWSDVQTNGITFDTIKYVAGKAAEGFKSPVILPDRTTAESDGGNNNPLGALTIISGRTAGGQDTDSSRRRSMVQFRSLSKDRTDALLNRCRTNEVSMSNALTAAMIYTASDFISVTGSDTKRNYKILQSLDMRRFGAQLDKGETVACMAGSHDLIHGAIIDESGSKIRKNPSEQRLLKFWSLATDGKLQTNEFIESDGPSHAVRVFDFAMTISDLNNLVHLTAQSKDTKGRAYSAGVTNAGVYEAQQAFPINDESNRSLLQINHGRFAVEDIYYATSHVTSGCLYQVSTLTVNGSMKLTFHPVDPIVDSETSAQFADAFMELLEKVSSDPVPHIENSKDNIQAVFQTFPVLAAIIGSIGVLSHASAWGAFFSSIYEMKANIVDPADFWSALNFWIFFAVGHPILQPILWISDVLHGSPGPMVAGLVPITFICGNILAIAAFTISAEIRNAVNIAVFAAFLTYIGAGLDGGAGLGDFNLALDDSYKGQIVKGCPAYEDVRQDSMKDFNIEKYQGLWHEQKFHDWTQFKEVYDTTLDIRLTEGGLGWIDDFGVKGPAPDAAPLSWDKSPVANGAHYFLFGRVDPNDPKGVLRESGFGVEFPNYIVDVKKDASGEYTEAIQFQCLERGGVRVFEGINFMSRNPTMTDTEMADMHSRAENAGMYPYGASPEQMHTVARRPVDAPPIDNNWQAMWRAIGVDKLLELLTKSIEDGGR